MGSSPTSGMIAKQSESKSRDWPFASLTVHALSSLACSVVPERGVGDMSHLSRRYVWFPVAVAVLSGACKSAWTQAQPTDNVLMEQAAKSSDDRDQLRLYLRDGEATVEGKVAKLTADSVALFDDSMRVARQDIARIDVRTGHHPVGALIAVALSGALLFGILIVIVSESLDF